MDTGAIHARAFLEGETILVLAGLFAHRGYRDWNGVILAAFVVSLGGDQPFFTMAAVTVCCAFAVTSLGIQTVQGQTAGQPFQDLADLGITFSL